MGEGFGDYIAAAMSSLTTGPPSSTPACSTGTRASYSTGLCARLADADLTTHNGLSRCFDDPQSVGLVWSSRLGLRACSAPISPVSRSSTASR